MKTEKRRTDNKCFLKRISAALLASLLILSFTAGCGSGNDSAVRPSGNGASGGTPGSAATKAPSTAPATKASTNAPATAAPTTKVPASETQKETTESEADPYASITGTLQSQNITVPDRSSWLGNEENKYVKSNEGVGIYIRRTPGKGEDIIDLVEDGQEVAVLARQSEFSLVRASGNRLGWCRSELLTDSNEMAASLPQLANSYWDFSYGVTAAGSDICLFHDDGTYSAYNHGGSAAYSEGVYKLQGRQLSFGSESETYLWDGNEFVSVKEYEIQAGTSGRRYLRRGTASDYQEQRARSYDTSYGYTDVINENGGIRDGEYIVEYRSKYQFFGKTYLDLALMKDNGPVEYGGPDLSEVNICITKELTGDCSIALNIGGQRQYHNSIDEIMEVYWGLKYWKIQIQNGKLVSIDVIYIA